MAAGSKDVRCEHAQIDSKHRAAANAPKSHPTLSGQRPDLGQPSGIRTDTGQGRSCYFAGDLQPTVGQFVPNPRASN
jgi:hypothetical protein